MQPMSRRHFVQAGTGLVGGLAAWSALSEPALAALATVAPAGSALSDIEHVVIFVQENRSFDHYFGTLSGVAGFGDPNVQVDALGRSVFDQFDPNALDGAGLHLLPFHLDTSFTSAQCLKDVAHDWASQHFSVAGGANNAWLTTHLVSDGVLGLVDGDPTALQAGGARVMGYHSRADLPFHYGLADAFTVCDRYFSSVIGPTEPNRIMLMTGTIDPDGTQGGPALDNSGTGFRWVTYPERLQAAGIDWYVYRERDDYGDNVLDHFVAYQDPTTELHRRGRSVVPDGQLPARLRRDVLDGNLPQVSWIVGPSDTTEHPDYLPAKGAWYTQQILEALTANPAVWAKTVLILTYDENGGFFDHVVPPLAPPGTPGEYVPLPFVLLDPLLLGVTGPVGLGPRVPTLLISPFTRGGFVSSDTFDHTSILRFLETRFGVEVPNLNEWRRATCGDLTSAFSFAGTPMLDVPVLPDTAALLAAASAQCATLPPPTIPSHQVMPAQEPGTRPRPSGLAGPTPDANARIVVTPRSADAPPTPASPPTQALPATGLQHFGRGALAGLMTAGGLATWWLRRGVGSTDGTPSPHGG